MAKIPGLNITAPVVPSQDTDTYPSHRAIYGYGGWREVATIADRDAIPDLRREAGMAVYVTSESKLYILNNDLLTWSEFKAGSTDSIRKTDDFTTFEPMFPGEIVQYIGETTENYTHAYFYKANPVKTTTVEFTPHESVETVVSIAPDDFKTFVETWCEGRPFTAKDVTHGDIGYYSEGRYSMTIFTDVEGQFAYASWTVEELEEAGFTFTPPLGAQQGVDFTCAIDQLTGYTYSQIDVQPATDLIWGNIEGDITNQTDLNNELTNLQDQIDSLSGRGRYLTLWNCSTGLAETNPPESPYTYQTGDYFIVGTVAASGGTNYRPDGSTYTTGVASTVVETDEVSIDDTYIYDGSTWHLQYNSQKTVTFTNIDGSPYDNTNLADALNSKVSKVDTASQVYGTDENGDETTYDLDSFGKVDDVQLKNIATGEYESVVENKIAKLAPEAVDIAYTNDQYPTMQTLQDAMDKLLYITPSVSLKIDGSGSDLTYEVGYTKQSSSLTWTWNKTIQTQSLNQGIGSLEANVRSYTYNTPITSETSFTITGSDGSNTKSSTRTIKFGKYYYYGTSSKDTLTDSDIRALASSTSGDKKWSGSNQTLSEREFDCTPTVSSPDGFYAYFVVPTANAKAEYTVKINGLPNTSYLKTTKDDYVNEYGVTIPMTIFRFMKNNKLTTKYNIEVS